MVIIPCGYRNQTGVTQKGGRFGRLMKPKPAAKPRRPAAKDGVASDHNGAAAATVPGTIRVVAVADWPGMTGAMAFANGDSGELVYSSDRGWLCIHMREHTGWVPADYWRIVTDVRPPPSSVQYSLIKSTVVPY